MDSIEIFHDSGPIDPQLIVEFEISAKLTLPEKYKALITQHNCLYPVNSSFDFKNIYANDYAWSYKIENEIDSRSLSFFGFGSDIAHYEQVGNQDFDVYGHDHVIAFGQSANGDYICFDYRKDPSTDEPGVVVMFHDAYDANRKMLICPVADSFEQFMDSLYAPKD
jgi:SMI1 / KNR4 family (SUKH-1)